MTIKEQSVTLTIQYDDRENNPPSGWDWPTMLDHPRDMVKLTSFTEPIVGEDDWQETCDYEHATPTPAVDCHGGEIYFCEEHRSTAEADFVPHDPAGRTLPEWERITQLPVMLSSQTADLRLEVHYPAETNFAEVRLWTSRGTVADGEPFEHTVYVEVRDVNMGEIMPGGGRTTGDTWYDLGHYDGDNPPEALPGLTATALRNMIDLPEPGE